MEESMLNILVDSYSTKFFRPGMSEKEKNKIKQGVIRDVKEEILSHIEQEQLAQMQQKVEAEETQLREQLYQKRISSVILEAVFIAFFVGLIVNQVTSVFDAWRTSLPEPFPIIMSLILIGILLFVLILTSNSLKWLRFRDDQNKKEGS